MAERVVILGGGVAGLSAAHELIERGFDVTVYEAKEIPGGKARSIVAPYTGGLRNVGTMHVGRQPIMRGRDLPGEHGFRFFPRFYRHIVDTMRRIPYSGGRTVADNLVATHKIRVTRFHRRQIDLPARFPRTLDDFQTLLGDLQVLWDPALGISWSEKLFFCQRIWQILTTCEERRSEEYEKIAWWDFIDAENRSSDYQKFFAMGITRSLVASRAEVASTKTIGDILVQLLFDIAEPGTSSDRVLNGPTNEVWIDPWLEYLRARGVQYRLNSRLTSFNMRHGLVKSVTIEEHRRLFDVQADYYIAAVPVEVMAELITPELIAADPRLENLISLSRQIEWMNGIQFYLTEDVPIVRGHVLYVDSPWALTSISQRQFWPDVDVSQRAQGQIRGIISVDISNWDTPGLNGKCARECTRDEIRDEVWAQLKLSLNVEGQDTLKDEQLFDYFLDPAIDPLTRRNGEPLLVNLIDSWRLRPDAVTAIPNLFLAADYVRTHTDLATMEAANEAARRAVNGIIRGSGRAVPACEVWQLYEPQFLEPLRAYDRGRYRLGLPWDDTLARTVVGILQVAGGLGPALGVAATAVLAVLDYLQAQFPHLRGLQIRPALLVRLAGIKHDPTTPLLGQLAPLLAQFVEELPGLLAAIRTALGTGGEYASSTPRATPRAVEPTAKTPAARPRPGASAASSPGDDARLRFVQR